MKTINIPFENNDKSLMISRMPMLMLAILCFSHQIAFGSTNITVRPYEIKFDYESGSSNDAVTLKDEYGVLLTKPEWKYSPSRENKIAYIKNQTNRKIKVKFDSNCDDMHLIINLSVSSGTGIGTLCNHVIMNYEDMQEVSLTLDGTIPGTVDERDFTWKWEIYAITNESGYCSATSTNYTDHSFYTLLATPKSPETEPRTHILGYACEWASGNSNEISVCEDILSNGFSEYYNYNNNCDQLSSDFVRMVTSLGITANLHKWYATQGGIGHMWLMKTKSFDPVGDSYSQGVLEWVMHQWAEAASYQWDPSANESEEGDWGDYEDALFTHYYKRTGVYSFVWDYNVPGQVTGCEVEPYSIHSDTPGLNVWQGPPQ
jgi:hypothetical protein